MPSQIDTVNVADSTPDLYQHKWTPLLVVVSGPSGVGKDTLLQRLKERGFDFAFVVTMTTRLRRENEVDGVDYFFVTREHFNELVMADGFLEYSNVYGDFKGIPKEQVQRAWGSGKDVVMRIDVQGAAKVRKVMPDAVTVFLIPESEDELIRRLTERKTETPEGLQRRITTAREEMKRLCEFDYVVVNPANQIDVAVDQLISIIRAEHNRAHRDPPCR